MTLNIISIRDRLKESILKIGQIRVYIFGSAIRPDTVPNDIDIFIIYDDPAQPRAIREFLREMNYIPVHLIFLTAEEEAETDFINKQNCVSIL
jgi:predicted nucleotidyltransferase